MSLLTDLNAYVESKGTSPQDSEKVAFFKDITKLIETNKLTASALTEKIKALNDEQRKRLFWLDRIEDASTASQAAQWILKLYQHLNIALHEAFLTVLVKGSLSKQDEELLIKSNYHEWQKRPTSKPTIAALEHELAVSLELEHDNRLSLAQNLLAAYNQQGLDYEKLGKDLQKLLAIAPQYVPQVIHELYLVAKSSSNETEQKQQVVLGQFNQLLFTIAEDQSDYAIYLAEAHPDIAQQLVDLYPELFFKLSPAMQRTVHKNLENDSAYGILERIFACITTFMDDKLPSGTLRELALEPTKIKTEIMGKLQSDAINSSALIVEHQGIVAIKLIENYLQEKPNQYKTEFFKGLISEIRESGLTVELLREKLADVDRKLLYAKWNGAQNSRAWGLVFELYQLANLTSQEEEIQHRSKNTIDPFGDELFETIELDKMKARKNGFLEAKVNQALLNSHAMPKSPLESLISNNVQAYENASKFGQRHLARAQAYAEAVYQNFLVSKALKKASETDPAKLIFDPQGHVLTFVTLQESDYEDIYKSMRSKPQFPSDMPFKERVEHLLGTKITETSFCNLDISTNIILREEFKKRIDPGKTNSTLLDNYLGSSSRTSVIALQEEMVMHVLLSLRALEKVESPLIKKAETREALMCEINEKVFEQFSASLIKATENGGINYVKLNQYLDIARKNLAQVSRELLVNKIYKENPEDFSRLERKINKELKEDMFTSTTATGLDYLGTDVFNESSILISGTEKTAHDKELGADGQAIRVISRCHYIAGADNEVIAYNHRTVEARVPSIAVKSVNHASAVKDVVDKLAADHKKLRERNGNYSGPVIYNLLTSLHTKLYDRTLFESANQQRLSAARILKGSHLYNLQQLNNGEPRALIYVQNIPVNQHTTELSYDAFDGAVREAAVMTDLALLATFNEVSSVFSPALRQSISKTFNTSHARYLRFLPTAKDGDHYFKDSEPGKWMMSDLTAKKAEWKSLPPMIPATDVPELAIQVLFKMMINDEHHNKQFGMLAQALSVYIEEMSMGGCKSANEREQGVAGRVGVLKSLNEKKVPFTEQQQKLLEALTAYVADKGTLVSVQQYLDVDYNEHNLHGAVASISMEDQGASSKVNATKNSDKGVVSEFNTNIAETGYLDRLWQNHSGDMQAHKAGLATEYKRLFAEHPQQPELQSLSVL